LTPPQLKDEITQLIKKIKDGKRVSHYDTIRIRKDSKHVDFQLPCLQFLINQEISLESQQSQETSPNKKNQN
jgi:hypothetical protein